MKPKSVNRRPVEDAAINRLDFGTFLSDLTTMEFEVLHKLIQKGTTKEIKDFTDLSEGELRNIKSRLAGKAELFFGSKKRF